MSIISGMYSLLPPCSALYVNDIYLDLPIGKATAKNIGLSKIKTPISPASQMQSSKEQHLAREPYVPEPY